MLMYSWDNYELQIDLYPLLEGAEINGVVLKWAFQGQEKFIKLTSFSLDDFRIMTPYTGICVSNIIETTIKDYEGVEQNLKFLSVSTALSIKI